MDKALQLPIEPPDTTKSRILSAARNRFETFGYRRTSIAEIAKDAGLAVGTFYGHFKSKEQILLKVIEQMNEAWLAKARRVLKEPGSAADRLAGLTEASVENNLTNRLLNSVLSRNTEMIPAPLLEPLHIADVNQNVAMIANVILDGIREGCFRQIDAQKAAFVIFTAGEALYRQNLIPFELLQPIINEITLRGLSEPTARRPPRTAKRSRKRGRL